MKYTKTPICYNTLDENAKYSLSNPDYATKFLEGGRTFAERGYNINKYLNRFWCIDNYAKYHTRLAKHVVWTLDLHYES